MNGEKPCPEPGGIAIVPATAGSNSFNVMAGSDRSVAANAVERALDVRDHL
jgi:hypothetical protein